MVHAPRPCAAGVSGAGDLPAGTELRDGFEVAAGSVGDGDDRRYVLLWGSEMLAQYGMGSLTGGFEVLLGVTPREGQASQYEAETSVDAFNWEDTRYIRYLPPGGAGGYQAEIWVVDQTG